MKSEDLTSLNFDYAGIILRLKIRHKLFLTLLLTSSIVAGGFFLLQWSFDRGFLDYVNSQELTELQTMAEELAKYYNREKGWETLKDNHHLWINIQRGLFHKQLKKTMALRKENSPPPQPPPRSLLPPIDKPPPLDNIEFDRRNVLYDLEMNRIIGGPPETEFEANTIPIKSEGDIIGYLGLIPALEISNSGDLLFVKQQKITFAVVALMMLGISLLLTFPVTIHLLRPINHLTEGTRRLIAGKFLTRIPITSRDELGRLSEHFNILAMTLEKNEEARRRWIADISHELRTPLSILRGEMEALIDGIRATGPDSLESLHSEILHMQRLVGDLYELSMSDIGALTYKKVPVDPFGILSGAVELFEHKYMEKGLELRFTIPEGFNGSILGDPDRLQQLFTNLLENSLRYTESPGMVEILARESENNVIITFEDSSPGVTEEQLPLLFDRMYRTDPSRHRAKNGAGLGLSICTNIVEAHQGRISSYSSPHGGLGIRIILQTSV